MRSMGEFSFFEESMGRRKMGVQRSLTNWFPQPFHRCHNREAGQEVKELKIAVWGNKDWVEGGMVRVEGMI